MAKLNDKLIFDSYQKMLEPFKQNNHSLVEIVVATSCFLESVIENVSANQKREPIEVFEFILTRLAQGLTERITGHACKVERIEEEVLDRVRKEVGEEGHNLATMPSPSQELN